MYKYMYIIKPLKNKLLFASANSIFIPYIFWIYLLLILAVSCVYIWNISSRNISSFSARLYGPINHKTSRLVFFWEKTRRDVLRRILWTGVRPISSKHWYPGSTIFYIYIAKFGQHGPLPVVYFFVFLKYFKTI